jgi:hypothetical protein
VESYPTCRGHDGGFAAGLQFFDTAEDLRSWALDHIDDYALNDAYDLDGNIAGDIKYDISGHRCSGIRLKIENESWRVADDGSGNKFWVKDNEE